MYRTRMYDLGLAGVFKKYANKILGANFNTANHWEVEDRLLNLINSYNGLDKVEISDLAKFHSHLERIHPFQDVNGKVSRFIF